MDTTRVGRGPGSSVLPVTVLFTTHPQFLAHDTGPGPSRAAVAARGGRRRHRRGRARRGAGHLRAPTGDRRPRSPGCTPSPSSSAWPTFIDAGGGNIDPDTVAVPASYAAALLAAGAGLESVARLDAGEGDVAFCAVRPPGHHATPTRSMGFCLLNNVAVTARALADRGERVLIVDYDAHHGNGTQDVFYDDGDVVYVSFHEFPLYPGTGRRARDGRGRRLRRHHQLPAAGRAPPATSTAPPSSTCWPRWSPPGSRPGCWCRPGYDGHRRDPITGLGLTAGDFADFTRDLSAVRRARSPDRVPRGRLRPRGPGRVGRRHAVARCATRTTAPRRRPAVARACTWSRPCR